MITPPSPPAPNATHAERLDWWRQARFGMFIHWGVYAIPGRGEWVRYEGIPARKYAKLARIFNPVKYNPRAWARLARAAGMRYMVLTTKHHDGFSLFDTHWTSFNAVRSAARRDLVREYAAACRAEGLGVGFYFSIKDWRHPNCPLAASDRMRQIDPQTRKPDRPKFIKFLKGQLTELLTQYGPIDILWFDGTLPALVPCAPDLAAHVRALQPGILMNNRLGIAADFTTPEQQIPTRPLTEHGRPVRWETCDTLTGIAWGYNQYDRNFRSAAQLIRRLATCASSGGNYLLNVGPRPDGAIQPEAVKLLRELGRWMQRYGDSIYGTDAGPVCYPPYGRLTRKNNRIYAHVFDWPANGRLALPQLAGQPASVSLINGQPLRRQGSNILLPRRAPDQADSVLVLDYDQPPRCLPEKPVQLRGPGRLKIGYHVARGRPIIIDGRIEAAAWGRVPQLRLTPAGHFDYAAERWGAAFRQPAPFACTLQAMHANNVLYLAAKLETDRLYIRPVNDRMQTDAVRFIIGAGIKCARLQFTPEAFELSVDAAGRAWVPHEDQLPGLIFRHAVARTPTGFTAVVAIPLAAMLKDRQRPDSGLRPGDIFRLNFIAVQAAPPLKVRPRAPAGRKPEWWEQAPDPWSQFAGCRHFLYWKGRQHEDPFYNLAAWDVWKIDP